MVDFPSEHARRSYASDFHALLWSEYERLWSDSAPITAPEALGYVSVAHHQLTDAVRLWIEKDEDERSGDDAQRINQALLNVSVAALAAGASGLNSVVTKRRQEKQGEQNHADQSPED